MLIAVWFKAFLIIFSHMKYFPFLILSGILLFTSCKKEDVETIAENIPVTVPIYQFSATPGNYWIYDWVEIDSNGVETPLGIQDSVYVVGDTLIGGYTYTHYKGTYMGSPSNDFYRDSGMYVVNQTGRIVFSRTNFGDTTHYHEDISANTKSYGLTIDYVGTITTPKQNFDVFDYQEHFYSLNGTPYTPCDSSWVKHTFYDQFRGFEVMGSNAFFSQLWTDCKYRKRTLIRGYF